MPVSAKTGRPKRYCKRSCRQRDFEARARAKRHGLDEAELIITREALESLRDQLYVVRCAMDDVKRDLQGSPTKQDFAEAVAWLQAAVGPLLAPSTFCDQRP
jgi:hypothetical protein